MKKIKKLIAIILVAVLFAGTGLADMGIKEVKANMEFKDCFDFQVEISGDLEAGNEVALKLHVKNNKPFDGVLNVFTHAYYEEQDGFARDFGELMLVKDDGTEIILTNENLETVTFAALETKIFHVRGVLPEEWNSNSSFYFEVGAYCTEEAYMDCTMNGSFAIGPFGSGSEGGSDDDDGNSGESGDDEFIPEEFYPDEWSGPISTNLYVLDGDGIETGKQIEAGKNNELLFHISNNTAKKVQEYNVKFYYYDAEGNKTEQKVDVYSGYGEDKTKVTSFTNLDLDPGYGTEYMLVWKAPADWEEEKCQFTAVVTNGEDVGHAAYPGGEYSTYDAESFKLTGVKVGLDNSTISFADGKEEVEIPIWFTAKVKKNWEIAEADIGFNGQLTGDYFYYPDKDVKKVGVNAAGETIFEVGVTVNKYMVEQRYALVDFGLVLKRELDYDINYDSRVNEEDIEQGGQYFNLSYEWVINDETGEWVLKYGTPEDPAEFLGFDWQENDLVLEYDGAADFVLADCSTEYIAPKITSIDFVTDPATLDSETPLTVEVEYEEDTSGIKSIELCWYNIKEYGECQSYWEADEIKSVTGTGKIQLTTDEFTSWNDKDEYYIGYIQITDYAGNRRYYGTDHDVDKQILCSTAYVYQPETGESVEEIGELENISFSRGNKHSYGLIATTKASASKKKNGKGKQFCMICGKKGSSSSKTLYYPKTYSIDDLMYVGNYNVPVVEIKDSNKKVIHNCFYDIEYPKDSTKVGEYKLKIKFKRNYTGTVTKTYKINPQSTELTSLTGAKKKFVAEWTPITEEVSGYQIKYSKYSSMKSSTTKTFSGKDKYTAEIKGLSAKKTYYVQVRTYKNVKVGKTTKKFYSSWSDKQKVKTK